MMRDMIFPMKITGVGPKSDSLRLFFRFIHNSPCFNFTSEVSKFSTQTCAIFCLGILVNNDSSVLNLQLGLVYASNSFVFSLNKDLVPSIS